MINIDDMFELSGFSRKNWFNKIIPDENDKKDLPWLAEMKDDKDRMLRMAMKELEAQYGNKTDK